MSPEVEAAFVGSLTTVATSVIGLGILIWRLRAEATRAIEELKTGEALKLKLRIYEKDVVPATEQVTLAGINLEGFIRNFQMQVKSHRAITANGFPGTVPSARTPSLIELKTAFDQEVIKVIGFVETWLVVDPRLAIFQTAFNDAKHDVDEAWGPYFQQSLKTYPIELPTGLRWALPTVADEDATQRMGQALMDSLSTITSYAIDFRAEMQTLLVGDIFGNHVPIRRPIDPRLTVITLDNAKALNSHFEHTPWGKKKRGIEEAVRSQLTAAGVPPFA